MAAVDVKGLGKIYLPIGLYNNSSIPTITSSPTPTTFPKCIPRWHVTSLKTITKYGPMGPVPSRLPVTCPRFEIPPGLDIALYLQVLQTRLQKGVGEISHRIFVIGYLDVKNHRGAFPPAASNDVFAKSIWPPPAMMKTLTFGILGLHMQV